MKKYETEYGAEFTLGFPIKYTDLSKEMILEIMSISEVEYDTAINDESYKIDDTTTDWLNLQDEFDAKNGIQLLWADNIEYDEGNGYWCYLGLQKDFSQVDEKTLVWNKNEWLQLEQFIKIFKLDKTIIEMV